MSEHGDSTQIPGFRGVAADVEPKEAELRRGALGMRSVMFQNMTNMAPAAAIVYDFPTQIAAAGAALWISNSIALFAVLLISSSIIQFAKHLPSAGGYYSYLSRSLGPGAGAFSAWIYFLYALLLPAEVTVIWAGIASTIVDNYLHVSIPWWIFEILIVGLVGFLAFTGVQRSARVTLIAGALEIGVFIALGIALLINPVSPIDFSKYKGKTLLIVNTASKCGYTPQYKELQQLHEQFGNKVTILGFPANNFGAQEPGTNLEIKEFCSKNYGVSFQMFEKVSVKGEDQHPL